MIEVQWMSRWAQAAIGYLPVLLTYFFVLLGVLKLSKNMLRHFERPKISGMSDMGETYHNFKSKTDGIAVHRHSRIRNDC